MNPLEVLVPVAIVVAGAVGAVLNLRDRNMRQRPLDSTKATRPWV